MQPVAVSQIALRPDLQRDHRRAVGGVQGGNQKRFEVQGRDSAGLPGE